MFNSNKAKCATIISYTLFFICNRAVPTRAQLFHFSTALSRKRLSKATFCWSGLACLILYQSYSKRGVLVPGIMPMSVSKVQLECDIFRKLCKAEPNLSMCLPWPGRESRSLDRLIPKQLCKFMAESQCCIHYPYPPCVCKHPCHLHLWLNCRNLLHVFETVDPDVYFAVHGYKHQLNSLLEYILLIKFEVCW